MAKEIVFTSRTAKPPATYSQAVKADGSVFVSGTAPHDPETGAIKSTTIQEQTRQCLANVAAILEDAGILEVSKGLHLTSGLRQRQLRGTGIAKLLADRSQRTHVIGLMPGHEDE
jgi:enamine deaminase RidA (YjgF/YER057c/UK114 family)